MQPSPSGGKVSGTLKTPPNTFIKVSKNSNQIISAQSQNVAKIKMIMPQKKATQRAHNIYKTGNATGNQLTNTNSTNAATVTNVPIRLNTSGVPCM